MNPANETVLLIHGIWMQGFMMDVLGMLLKRQGYRTQHVSYDFLKHSPRQNAAFVSHAARACDTRIVHLVGHSLGGIVILHALQRYHDLPPGKVVLIGSPVRGSRTAAKVHQHRLTRPLLGKSVEQGLLGGAPEYRGTRPLGIITGRGRFGLSALFLETDEFNDGVVTESETELKGVTDRISMPLSHTMLIYSRRCARQVAHFLRHSKFTSDSDRSVTED